MLLGQRVVYPSPAWSIPKFFQQYSDLNRVRNLSYESSNVSFRHDRKWAQKVSSKQQPSCLSQVVKQDSITKRVLVWDAMRRIQRVFFK